MHKLLAVFLLCAFSLPFLHASDDLWVGTWKLDPARSHFIGTTFTYSQTPDGIYHYSDGPKNTDTSFRIDGHEYKTQGSSTSTWTAAGDNAWDTLHKTNGAVVGQVHRQLSPDGNTFNMTAEGTQPDGTRYHTTLAYKRLTAGQGLLGKWVSTKVDSSVADTVVILPAPPGEYHWEYPAYKVTMEGKLGTDTPMKGPQVAPGSMVTLRRINAHRILYTFKLDGSVNTVGVQTLSRDGQSFTDDSWIPGKKGRSVRPASM